MERTKVIKEAVVTVCDHCETEIVDGQIKKFSLVDLCPRCYGVPPAWALRYAEEVWAAICNFEPTARAALPLTKLASGIWILSEGREDGGALFQVASLAEAKEQILEGLTGGETDSNLVDVFQDGQDLGAVVQMDVKFTKKK